MGHSADLETILDQTTRAWDGVQKKKMFGGVVYMIHGNICVGIWQDQLILRAGEAVNTMMADDGRFRPFDVTGRVMKGWTMLAPEGWRDPPVRRGAIKTARNFCQTLPKKV
jgi:TfoX/Sxy family transcriptional regulator of competence genes